MQLRNTSRYPIDEVRELVRLGFNVANAPSERIAVHVKNCRNGAYAGMAYRAVPRMSNAATRASADRLVTLRVGAPERFPADNVVTVRRWRYEPWMTLDELRARNYPLTFARTCRYVDGVEQWRAAELIVERRPYGGKSAPEYTVCDWREALVAVAAHEGRHLYQYQRNKPASEVDAERAAARALDVYRRT